MDIINKFNISDAYYCVNFSIIQKGNKPGSDNCDKLMHIWNTFLAVMTRENVTGSFKAQKLFDYSGDWYAMTESILNMINTGDEGFTIGLLRALPDFKKSDWFANYYKESICYMPADNDFPQHPITLMDTLQPLILPGLELAHKQSNHHIHIG